MAYAALVLLAAYLLGSIPFPLIVSRLVRGIDLRNHGSGNMGTMNATTVLGKQWFPVVLGLDLSKGLAAAYLAMRLLPGELSVSALAAAALAGLTATLGHCFPVFAGFRGGLGLAASAGALLLISPALLAAALAAIGLLWALSRNLDLAVAGAGLLFPLLGWWLLREIIVVALLAVWGLLIAERHWPRVRRWWRERG